MAEKTAKKKPEKGVSRKVAKRTTRAGGEKKCSVEGCKRPYRAKGYCFTHYTLWRRGEQGKKQRYKTCSKEGCKKKVEARGLCAEHVAAEKQAS